MNPAPAFRPGADAPAVSPCPGPQRAATARRLPALLAALGLSLLAACGGGGGGGAEGPASPQPGAGSGQGPNAGSGAGSGANPGTGDGAGSGSGTPNVLSLAVQGNSARTAGLQWSAAPGATGYTLERRSAQSPWAVIATLGPAENRFLDDGLTPETTYTWRIAAQGLPVGPAEQSATTTSRAPLVTAAAAVTPDAPVATGTIGPAGGSVATADGALRVALPAGALAAPTAVTLQRTSNPLAADQGPGTHVRLQAQPSQPLALTLRYGAAMDAHADGLALAVQRADGSWLSVPVTAVDKGQRTLSATLSPALVARAADAGRAQAASADAGRAQASSAGTASRTAADDKPLGFIVVGYLNVHLSPRQATLETGRTQLFVPYAHTEGLACWEDPDIGCLPEIVTEKREIPLLNQKAGYARRWYVFAEEGGTPALGTVVPRPQAGAVYQAPAREPTPNPVQVAFRSTHARSGRTVTLAASVQVREPVWTMILSGVLERSDDIGFSYGAEAVWTREGAGAGGVDTYRASGTQRVNVINVVCTASASPASVALPPGALVIDRSVEPARYRLDVGSVWNTAISGTCPGGGFANVPAQVPGRLVVEGTLSANGTRIEGSASQNHVTWNWALTNGL